MAFLSMGEETEINLDQRDRCVRSVSKNIKRNERNVRGEGKHARKFRSATDWNEQVFHERMPRCLDIFTLCM